ncbi:MAG: DUF1801 domain-containing protein [Actinomyces sp.]|nr:DUF1801 domain-containing protein [Actinomyces sp.]
MAHNITVPTGVPVEDHLESVSARRREEARVLIGLMEEVTNEPARMWGPSIIGFGSYHDTYESGRQGDAALAGFSPRAAKLSIYLPDGCARHEAALARLGPHTTAVSCLYVTRLSAIDLEVLRDVLTDSVATVRAMHAAPTTPED